MSEVATIDVAAELEQFQTEPESPPESSPSPNGDTAPKPADAAEQEVDDFLSARKESQAQKGTETGAKGDEGEEDELPELKEAKEAAAKATAERVERETKQRLDREALEQAEKDRQTGERKRYEDTYRVAMESAGPKLKAELIEVGVDSARAESIANKYQQSVNSLYADGLKLHEPMVMRRLGEAYASLLNDAFKAELGSDAGKFLGSESEPKDYKSVGDALKAFRAQVTEGLKTPSEVDAAVKTAVLAYRHKLEEKGLINGSHSGQRVNGSSGASESKDGIVLGADGEPDVAASLAAINATSRGI